jgi:hypothetical protein
LPEEIAVVESEARAEVPGEVGSEGLGMAEQAEAVAEETQGSETKFTMVIMSFGAVQGIIHRGWSAYGCRIPRRRSFPSGRLTEVPMA